MENLNAVLEPIKIKAHEILRNPRARILRIHISRDFKARLRAAGEMLQSDAIDGSEYYLLGYPCEVHREKFVYIWAVEYQTMVDISPETAELKTVLSGEINI